MPCCAFAAAIIGQLILALAAVKRAVLGYPPQGLEARNAAVEWRLDSPAAPVLAPAPRSHWLGSRRVVGGLVLAAAFELLIILGGAYGLIGHLGHGKGAEHAAHVHAVTGAQTEGVQR